MKVPRITSLIACALLFGTASARSQTLNWASLTQSEIVDSQGIALAGNTYVFELGTFEEGFVPDESNLSEWVLNWHVFDTADYHFDQFTSTGTFSGTADAQEVSDYSSMFQGFQAYLFVRNSTDTEYFLARPAGSTAWTFPVLDESCCPNGEVTTWSVSDLSTDAPIWGSQGGIAGGGTGVAGSYDLQTYSVPETGPSLLALVGGGCMVFRRRRAEA